MIKQEIQKILDNTDKFKLYKPENVLKWSRFMFYFDDKDENKIVLILSNLTNAIELSIKKPNDTTFDKFNFDLSIEENNLLCMTFAKILCQKRLEYRQNSKEDWKKKKEEDNKKLDKNTLKRNKSLQKKAYEFLNKVNFKK